MRLRPNTKILIFRINTASNNGEKLMGKRILAFLIVIYSIFYSIPAYSKMRTYTDEKGETWQIIEPDDPPANQIKNEAPPQKAQIPNPTELKKDYSDYCDDAHKGKISLGMPRDLVAEAWGNPNKINKSVGRFGVHEQWVYSHGENYLHAAKRQYVYIENGVVTSWQQ